MPLNDFLEGAKRGVSEETQKVFGMKDAIANDTPKKRVRTSDKFPAHPSGLDVQKVKKDPHKK